jgi:MFS family permease
MAVNIINACAFGMITPVVPGYIVSMGISLAFAGTVTGLFSISALIARPLASILGDRLNKKRLLMVWTCLNGLSIISYVLAPGVLWLLLIRISHGIMFSVSTTISYALGVEYVPKEKIGEGVGYLGVSQIIGMAIGPTIGIYLVNNHSYQLCFILSGAVIAAIGLSVFMLKYEHTVSIPPLNKKRPTISLRDLIAVELLPNALFVAVFASGTGLINSYLAMFGNERKIANIGLYFMVNSIVVLAVRPVVGKMIDRKGVAFIILPGFIISAAAMTIIAYSHLLWSVLFAAVLAAIGISGSMPAIQADCLKKLDSSRKTVATGTYLIGIDIGMSAGQIFGGVLTNSYGFTATFCSVGALSLAGFCLYLLYHRYR